MTAPHQSRAVIYPQPVILFCSQTRSQLEESSCPEAGADPDKRSGPACTYFARAL